MGDAFTEEREKGLTQESFEGLLRWLDSDAERAGEKYERLRARLVNFLDWQGCPSPEDSADEILNRIARSISAGLRTDDLNRYAFGVARNVLKESWRAPERVTVSFEALPPSQHPKVDLEKIEEAKATDRLTELRLRCLQHCLEKLPPESRALLTQYYRGTKRAKIEARKELAEHLGLAPNTLRIRAYRLREKLEACIEACVKRIEAKL